MRTHLGSVFFAVVMVSIVCGNAAEPSNGAVGGAQAPAGPSSNQVAGGGSPAMSHAANPVIQPILTAWQEGHRSEAVDLFVRANWADRPIFPAGMVLNLTEAQFKSLSDSERQLRGDELTAQLDLVKQLASAVSNAGRNAASTGDAERARQCYSALKQFGVAIDGPKALTLLKMVGQVSIKMADRGLASLGK
jgi:hypothetical protein